MDSWFRAILIKPNHFTSGNILYVILSCTSSEGAFHLRGISINNSYYAWRNPAKFEFISCKQLHAKFPCETLFCGVEFQSFSFPRLKKGEETAKAQSARAQHFQLFQRSKEWSAWIKDNRCALHVAPVDELSGSKVKRIKFSVAIRPAFRRIASASASAFIVLSR